MTNQAFNLSSGLNFIEIGLNKFANWKNLDRSHIVSLWFTFHIGGISDPHSMDITLDDLRVVKADPDDANQTNDTGSAWDKARERSTSAAGVWHVYPGNRPGEPSFPFAYGQIRRAGLIGADTWYLSHKPLSTTAIYTGTLQAGLYLKDANGQAGLGFFVQEVAPDQWTMYAVEADSADQIRLVKWVAGVPTVLSTASFPFAANQLLWLGVDFSEFDLDAGRIRVFANLVQGDLIQADHMVISTQDTSLAAGGSVGLLSRQAKVRFVEFLAGSPAHARYADNAGALRGPLLTETGPLFLRDKAGDLEKSSDGVTYSPVGGGQPTELYRPDKSQTDARITALGDLEADGAVQAGGDVSGPTLISTVPTGTPPLIVASQTRVTDLNVDLVDGYHANEANVASTLAARNGSGDVVARLFRPEHNAAAASFNFVNVQNARGAGVDNYIRAASLDEFRDRLGVTNIIGYAEATSTKITAVTTPTNIAGMAVTAFCNRGTAYVIAAVNGFDDNNPTRINWTIRAAVDGSAATAQGEPQTFISNATRGTSSAVLICRFTGLSVANHTFRIQATKYETSGSLKIADDIYRRGTMLVLE